MTQSIVMESVVKTFGQTRALDGVDLRVATGEVHGFLGPNGAGKSTAIRVLLGLLKQDSGYVELLGGNPWDDAVELHRRLAYVPGEVELWPNLTGGEIIDIFGRLRGPMDRSRRDELCELFALDPSKKSRTYSKGNRQKVALISALVTDVELLLLDEPTAGLDPLMEAAFQDYIQRLQNRGVTVLLSSHILAQVESLANRISIIRDGQIVESGTLDELRHLQRIHINVIPNDITKLMSSLVDVHNLQVRDDQVSFDVEKDDLSGVLGTLGNLGVGNLEARPPTLEELLLRHYGVRRGESNET